MAEPGGTAHYCCGEVLDANNLAWDFRQPDDFGDLTAEERAKAITFESRIFIVAEGYGTAARSSCRSTWTPGTR